MNRITNCLGLTGCLLASALAGQTQATEMEVSQKKSQEKTDSLGLYLGLEAGYSDIELEELKDSESYRGYLGYNFIDAFGLEVAYSSLGEFDVDVPGAQSSIEIDNVYQMALVFNGPLFITDKGNIHARYGYYQATVTPNNTNSTAEETDTGNFFYSLGVSYPVLRPLSLTFNYAFYNDIEDQALSNFSLGLRLDF